MLFKLHVEYSLMGEEKEYTAHIVANSKIEAIATARDVFNQSPTKRVFGAEILTITVLSERKSQVSIHTSILAMNAMSRSKSRVLN